MNLKLLPSTDRLDEVFLLRVNAYETFDPSGSINSTRFPGGLFDHLDERSHHFIKVDKEGRIIAASRLSRLNSLGELPNYQIFQGIEIPSSTSLWYFSRMVVHPGYWGRGICREFFASMNKFLEAYSGDKMIMPVKEWRLGEYTRQGWEIVGNVDYSLDPTYPFSTKEMLYVLMKQIGSGTGLQ